MTDVEGGYIPMPGRVLRRVYGDGSEWKSLLYALLSRRTADDAGREIASFFSSGWEAVLTDSGASALILSLRAGGIGRGDDVIVSTFNCPQVIDAVLATGANPRLCDCDTHSGAPSVVEASRVLTRQTRAIVITHQWGEVSSESVRLAAWAKARGLWVVDDAAQVVGSKVEGRYAGTLGDAGVLSFGRTKPWNCLGGGALLVQSGSAAIENLRGHRLRDNRDQFRALLRPQLEDLARLLPAPLQARALKRLGAAPMSSSVKAVLESRSPSSGTPGTMSKYSARALIPHAKRALRDTQEWRLRARKLHGLVLQVTGFDLPPVYSERYNGAYFAMRVPARKRSEIGARLSSNGFQTSWFHFPLHLISHYRQYAAGPMPNSEELCQSILILPCRSLGKAARRRMVEVIRDCEVPEHVTD